MAAKKNPSVKEISKKTSLNDLMLLIELETLLLKDEHCRNTQTGNVSAGRRARVCTIKLTHYLKEYRQKSMKVQVPE